MDWEAVFEECRPKPWATDAELMALETLWSPLTREEATKHFASDEDLAARALSWRIAGARPPASYIGLLRYSNGGYFRNGERSFAPLFAVQELRSMMIGYCIPEDMPNVLPFAFDGGGVFCAFDMREPPVDDEFPIVAFHASTPFWGEATLVGASFEEVCRARTRY